MSLGEQFDDVLAAAVRGEDWAWAQLYRDLAPSILGYLSGHGVPEAEDLTGECFVHIVRGIARFAGDEAAFRSWVFTIAHHRLVDYWRRHHPARLRLVGSDELPRNLDAELSGGSRPESEVVQRAAVNEILGRLNPAQRDVLLLRVVQQFSVRETAQILGKSEGAVKLLQNRALKALRLALKDPAKLEDPEVQD